MSAFRPCCLPTAIGSMPQAEARDACDLVARYLPEFPVWPQLPNRSPLESMYVQYFERLPGATVAGGRLRVERGPRLEAELESLYADYLAGRSESYALSAKAAAGFVEMRRRLHGGSHSIQAIKGQVTGPVSAGIQITGEDDRPVLYDDVLADALAKYISLVAREQERSLGQLCGQTIMFLDEPYLSAVGSAFIQVRRDQAIQLLTEVLEKLTGLKGVHCCGNTDWSLVLSTPIDILSFDAYDFADTLALYSNDVQAFLSRGGVLAWGIIPTDQKALQAEDVVSLVEKFHRAVGQLVAKGLNRQEIMTCSLITPACGLGPLPPALAVRALEFTVGVSNALRVDAKKWEN